MALEVLVALVDAADVAAGLVAPAAAEDEGAGVVRDAIDRKRRKSSRKRSFRSIAWRR